MKIPVRKNSSKVVSGGGACLPSRQRISRQSRGASESRMPSAAAHSSPEAVLYLRTRGWTGNDSFSIQTVAGEMRPRITGPTTCTMDMGRAKITSKDYPSGSGDGTGRVEGFEFQHVSIGNPQCSIEIKERDDLEALDLPVIGPPIEHSDLFPNRSNVSSWTRTGNA